MTVRILMNNEKSKTHAVKHPLPKGIFLIALWCLIALGLHLAFDLRQFTALLAAVFMVNALLSVGLLLCWEPARRVFLGLQVAIVILAGVNLVGLIELQLRSEQQQEKIGQALGALTSQATTPEQKSSVIALQNDMDAKTDQIATAYSILYARSGLTILGAIATVWYLLRPKVRRAFRRQWKPNLAADHQQPVDQTEL